MRYSPDDSNMQNTTTGTENLFTDGGVIYLGTQGEIIRISEDGTK